VRYALVEDELDWEGFAADYRDVRQGAQIMQIDHLPGVAGAGL
jgi:hypothetical protein